MSFTKILGMALLVPGCASPLPAAEVDSMLGQAVNYAQVQAELGNDVEAWQLVSAVSKIDPDYEGVAALNGRLESAHEDLFDHPMLGSNVRKRPHIERSTTGKVLWYLPDRLLDFMDVVSLDVHLGVGLFANAHATRALQFGAGARTVGGFGWHDHRSLGLMAQAESGLSVAMFGTEAYGGALVGSSGVLSGSSGIAGLYLPSDELYQDFRDYWAVGAGFTVLVVGADFDLHPIELADFLVGWSTIDFLNDDFAGTRGLDLSGNEASLARDLGRLASRPAKLEPYRDWVARGRPADR